MTQNDGTPDSLPGQGSLSGPGVMTAPTTSTAGEVLGGRYRLEEHINDDATGRQVWRGLDVVLRRPIALVLRHPGGPSAAEMLSGAVAASRIVHPHMVDVYDAIDDGDRAYIVREWVDGTSLRDLVADGPLDTVKATAIAHAIASAVAAAHASGMVHGNIHPGTVLVADDGRVMLADARADDEASAEGDVRAVGAVLYCALTGHWPHAEVGPDRLPDALRDPAGALVSPRQVRGGLPSYLSELATQVLDLHSEPPSAEQLSLDLGRLDTEANDEFYGEGPLGFTSAGAVRDQGTHGHSARNLLIGVLALVVIATGGVLLAKNIGGGPAQASIGGKPTTTASANASTGPTGTQGGGGTTAVPLTVNSLRLVETKGDGKEFAGLAKAIDGNQATNWHSSWYTSAKFGDLKSGIGLLIDMGSVRNVTSVQVNFLTKGEDAQAYVGNTDPGLGNTNTEKILQNFAPIGSVQNVGVTGVFSIGQPTRYVLIWVSSLPPSGSYGPKNTYLFGITEVSASAS